MEGISLVETQVLNKLIDKVESLQAFVEKAASNNSPYLTIQEAAELMGFSEVWMSNNKQHIGYTSIGRAIRFKRKDVEAYMEQNYFKTKRRK